MCRGGRMRDVTRRRACASLAGALFALPHH